MTALRKPGPAPHPAPTTTQHPGRPGAEPGTTTHHDTTGEGTARTRRRGRGRADPGTGARQRQRWRGRSNRGARDGHDRSRRDHHPQQQGGARHGGDPTAYTRRGRVTRPGRGERALSVPSKGPERSGPVPGGGVEIPGAVWAVPPGPGGRLAAAWGAIVARGSSAGRWRAGMGRGSARGREALDPGRSRRPGWLGGPIVPGGSPRGRSRACWGGATVPLAGLLVR